MSNKLMKTTAFALIILVLAAMPAWAYQTGAEEPGDVGKTQAQLNGYSEEEWAKLMDNNLEYGEIEALVHTFNPDMAFAWKSFEDGVDDVAYSRRLTKNIVEDLEDNIETYSALLGADSPAVVQLKAALAQTKAGQKTLSETYHNLTKDTSSAKSAISFGEKQLVNGVKQLVVAYNNIMVQKTTLDTLTGLYQESYNANLALLSQGMATSQDILSAQSNLLSAQSNTAALEAAGRQIYQQILVLCGWQPDAAVTIGGVPDPDMNLLATYNPETDYTKAAGNNSTLKALRNSTEKPKKTTARTAYIENEEALKSALRANVNQAYGELMQAKAEYEASQLGAQAAAQAKRAADVQYQQGLVSKAQYIGSSITAVQKDAAVQSARLSLVGEMLSYESMLCGSSNVE